MCSRALRRQVSPPGPAAPITAARWEAGRKKKKAIWGSPFIGYLFLGMQAFLGLPPSPKNPPFISSADRTALLDRPVLHTHYDLPSLLYIYMHMGIKKKPFLLINGGAGEMGTVNFL